MWQFLSNFVFSGLSNLKKLFFPFLFFIGVIGLVGLHYHRIKSYEKEITYLKKRYQVLEQQSQKKSETIKTLLYRIKNCQNSSEYQENRKKILEDYVSRRNQFLIKKVKNEQEQDGKNKKVIIEF